ncbi:uncharacterized protein LOC144155082 [Haemaphysalis longicornis]
MDATGQDGEAYSRRMPWTALLTSSSGGPSGFKAGAKYGVFWSGGSFRDREPQWARCGDADRHSAVRYESYVLRAVSGMVSAARSKQPPTLAACSCPSKSYVSAVANVIGSDGKVAATVYGSSQCLHVKLRRLDLLRRYFISLDLEVDGEDRRDDVDYYLMPEPNHLDGFQWFQFEFTINVASLLRGRHGSSEGRAYRLTMRVVQLTDECWPAGPDPVLLCLREENCRDWCHPQKTGEVDPWTPETLRSGPEGLDNFAHEINKSFAIRTSFSTVAAHVPNPPGLSHGLVQTGSCWGDIGSGMARAADASCYSSVCNCCPPSEHGDCDVGDRHLQSSSTTFFRDLDSEVELALTKIQLRELNDPQCGRFEVPRHWEDPH